MRESTLILIALLTISTLFAEETKEKPALQNIIENVYTQQGHQLWGQWGQQGVDAAKAVNGTWQIQWQIQTTMGTQPYSATETWTYDAKRGIFYDGAGWMWRGRSAGNYLQVQTQLATGAQAMLTIQFLSNNEAVGNMNVSATRNLSPCMGQFRAVRVQ